MPAAGMVTGVDDLPAGPFGTVPLYLSLLFFSFPCHSLPHFHPMDPLCSLRVAMLAAGVLVAYVRHHNARVLLPCVAVLGLSMNFPIACSRCTWCTMCMVCLVTGCVWAQQCPVGWCVCSGGVSFCLCALAALAVAHLPWSNWPGSLLLTC